MFTELTKPVDRMAQVKLTQLAAFPDESAQRRYAELRAKAGDLLAASQPGQPGVSIAVAEYLKVADPATILMMLNHIAMLEYDNSLQADELSRFK